MPQRRAGTDAAGTGRTGLRRNADGYRGTTFRIVLTRLPDVYLPITPCHFPAVQSAHHCSINLLAIAGMRRDEAAETDCSQPMRSRERVAQTLMVRAVMQYQ